MKQLLITGGLIFLIMMLMMYFWQRHLIYFPSRETPNRLAFQAGQMQVVTLHTEDHLRLNAWYKPAESNQPTILHFHGNAGHIGFRMPLAHPLIASGFGVLLVEYRGYGGNEGSASEQGLYQDGRAAVQFLRSQGVPLNRMVFFGESLGTGIAVKLATEYPVCSVILQSPFTSLVDLARYHHPWIFLKPWDRFESLARIQAIQAPLLILHGKQDEIVPYAQGALLFKQAREPKKMKSFPGAGHNNLWGQPGFIQEILTFMDAYCQESQ